MAYHPHPDLCCLWRFLVLQIKNGRTWWEEVVLHISEHIWPAHKTNVNNTELHVAFWTSVITHTKSGEKTFYEVKAFRRYICLMSTLLYTTNAQWINRWWEMGCSGGGNCFTLCNTQAKKATIFMARWGVANRVEDGISRPGCTCSHSSCQIPELSCPI